MSSPLFVLTAALALLTTAQGAVRAAETVSATASGSGSVKKFTLVYTVNGFGAIEPQGCPHKVLHDGGLARRRSLLRQIEAAEAPVLLLDGGSSLFPEIDKPPDDEKEKLFLKAELVVEAMSRMGYKASAVGTTDLLLGLGELIHLTGRGKFPFLAANMTSPTGNPFKPYIILEVAGLRVGVFGLIAETMGKVYLAKVAPGIELQPSVETARKVVAELKGKVDLIVALAHVRQDASERLAKEVEGIDIVIDPAIEYGNHHPRIKDEEWEETIGRAVRLRSNGNGQSIGVVEIEFKKPGAGMGSRRKLDALLAQDAEGKAGGAEKAEIRDLQARNLYSIRPFDISPHFPDDFEMAALIDAFKKGNEVTSVPVQPIHAGRADYLTTAGCKDCHKKQYDNWTRTKHSKALATIQAYQSDQKPECISCHATGYGPAFTAPADLATFGDVQCEACHGTRPQHAKSPKTIQFGAIAESVCLPCHNEDILRKPFSFSQAILKVRCPEGS